MKKTIFFLIGGFLSAYSYSQTEKAPTSNCNAWSQQANFPGVARYYVAGFSIGNYGYIGCGSNSSTPTSYNDFYKWNETTNTWTAIASYPGAGYEYTPVSFSIEGYGYVGLGWTGSNGATDLWRYDTATNTWTQMASLPGPGRYDESVFVIGHKAWIIGGSPGGPPYFDDVWMYDAHQNTWTQKNNSPAGQTDGGAAFAIGKNGYIGGGNDGSAVSHSAFYEYDTTSDTWTPIDSFPITLAPTGDSRAFVIGSKGYVCTGTINTIRSNTLPSCYMYDTVTKAWSYSSDLSILGIGRGYAAAFAIGNCGFIGTGQDSAQGMRQDLWGYCICGEEGGVDQVNAVSPSISLYPIPSNGNLTLSYSNLTSSKSELSITNILGSVIYSTSLTGFEGEMNLNLGNISNGVYFYQIISGNKSIIRGKFVITK